jgi:hypothetical protein
MYLIRQANGVRARKKEAEGNEPKCSPERLLMRVTRFWKIK